VLIETTKLGTDEQDKFTRRPSARRTMRFPFGQMMWSTWKCKYTTWWSQKRLSMYLPVSELSPMSNLEFSKPLCQFLCSNDPCYKQWIRSLTYPCVRDSQHSCCLWQWLQYLLVSRHLTASQPGITRVLGEGKQSDEKNRRIPGIRPYKLAKHKSDQSRSQKRCNPLLWDFEHNLCQLDHIHK